MKVDAVKLIDFFAKPQNQFEVPLFQRNYCWKRQQVEMLIEDIINISDKNYDHFLGSFLLFEKRDNEFEIIDGQQRFMTLSLLVKALSKHPSKLVENQNKINHLNNMIISIDGKLKLKPQSVDQEEFSNIILKSDPEGNTSYLATAYLTCLDYIEDDQIFEKIYDGLDKIILSVIIVDKSDQNKQTIFEKMNSLGVDLTLFDICRNQLFYKVPLNEDLNHLYSNYWLDVERNLSNLSKDDFINVYIDSRSNVDLSGDKSKYNTFKNIVDNEIANRQSLELLFKDLKRSSRIYANIKGIFNDYDHQVTFLLSQFKALNVSSVNPFLMSILRKYTLLKEPSTSIYEVFQVLITYLVRTLAADNKTFSFNKSNYQIFQLLESKLLLEPEIDLSVEAKINNEKLIGYGGRLIRYIYRYIGLPSDSTVSEDINKGIFKTGSKGRFFYAIATKNINLIDFNNLEKVRFVDINKNYERRLGILSSYTHTDKLIKEYKEKTISLVTMISQREDLMSDMIIENYPIKYNLFKKSQKITVKINSSIDFSKVKLSTYKISKFTEGKGSFANLYRDILYYTFKKNPMQFVEWADINKNFTSTGDTPHISYSPKQMAKHLKLDYKNKEIFCNLNLSTNQIIFNSKEILDQNVKNVSLVVFI